MSYVGRGSHPNSLANLKHEGRPPITGERKRNRTITVTDTGWQNAQSIASSLGMSISELVEKLGREEIKIVVPEPEEVEKVS